MRGSNMKTAAADRMFLFSVLLHSELEYFIHWTRIYCIDEGPWSKQRLHVRRREKQNEKLLLLLSLTTFCCCCVCCCSPQFQLLRAGFDLRF
ncbi:hypothetical protein CIPAW_15G160100 [Carya illinoinensis]|uniref:Uncharacterized protein n=1 Tax=Carya illinoinensis TaxID=32201 RepID=A0A8T1N824_CARIL|nr:hypothetical protein CIPAW_15G160100 [Carya illinoinensis]